MNEEKIPDPPGVEPAAAAAAPRPLSDDTRQTVKRVHAGVLLFYVVDALLLTAYGAVGVVAPQVGWMYGVVGGGLAAVSIHRFWRRGGRLDEIDNQTLLQTALASIVMLATMGLAPQVSGLMLMSLLALMSLSALSVRGLYLIGLCTVLAGGSTWVLSIIPAGRQFPASTPVERSLTGLWLLWLMLKASAQNAAGRKLRALVSQTNSKLAQALSDLEKVASTDDLSNLPNRRSILKQLKQALEQETANHRLGVAVLDIDHFKRVNDRFGHDVGDQVLRLFSERVSRSLRPGDRVGRYGGEEFLILLQQLTDDRSAQDAVERVCRRIEAEDWSQIAAGLAVTVSAGVAVMRPDETSDAAIQRADAALYEAKRRGRNQVVSHEALQGAG